MKNRGSSETASENPASSQNAGLFAGLSLTILVLIVQFRQQFSPIWFFALTAGLATVFFIYSALEFDNDVLARLCLVVGFIPFMLLLLAVVFIADFLTGVIVAIVAIIGFALLIVLPEISPIFAPDFLKQNEH